MATSTVSRKVEINIDSGLWVPYGHPTDGYSASVSRIMDDETGKDIYTINYYQHAMPALNSQAFDTLPALIARMREVEPDLRRWHTTSEE